MKLPVKKNEHNIPLLRPISQSQHGYGKKEKKLFFYPKAYNGLDEINVFFECLYISRL